MLMVRDTAQENSFANQFEEKPLEIRGANRRARYGAWQLESQLCDERLVHIGRQWRIGEFHLGWIRCAAICGLKVAHFQVRYLLPFSFE